MFASDHPEVKEFSEQFKALAGYEASESSSSVYLATLTLLDALNRAGPDAKEEQLRDAIRATNFKTVVGTAAWNKSGDLTEPVIYVGVRKAGKPVTEKRLVL